MTNEEAIRILQFELGGKPFDEFDCDGLDDELVRLLSTQGNRAEALQRAINVLRCPMSHIMCEDCSYLQQNLPQLSISNWCKNFGRFVSDANYCSWAKKKGKSNEKENYLCSRE